ncbi:MAG TPA: cation diffusion facilitator family transporter [Dongiaceae bacterium]|nr:cation diffusion facilitator family transporter [Dongiaceae bacterium]
MAIDPKNARLMRRAGIASVAAAMTLIVIKLYAFVETGSVSMLSTLFDSALDFGASLINLFAISQAVVPADAEHRFGHGKAEPLAGLVQVGFILGSSILLLWEVADHFLHPQQVQHATLGVSVMVLSIIVTGALILFQRSVVKRTGSLAVTADAAHYGSDFVVNISVIVALVLSSLFGWWWIDPLCGLLVAVWIGLTALSIGRQALDMLMDREMEDADREKIKEIARAHPEVVDLHDLRTRVSGQDRFIQFHLELSPDILLKTAHRISDEVEAKLVQAFPGAEVIIHQDPYGLEERRARFR